MCYLGKIAIDSLLLITVAIIEANYIFLMLKANITH